MVTARRWAVTVGAGPRRWLLDLRVRLDCGVLGGSAGGDVDIDLSRRVGFAASPDRALLLGAREVGVLQRVARGLPDADAGEVLDGVTDPVWVVVASRHPAGSHLGATSAAEGVHYRSVRHSSGWLGLPRMRGSGALSYRRGSQALRGIVRTYRFGTPATERRVGRPSRVSSEGCTRRSHVVSPQSRPGSEESRSGDGRVRARRAGDAAGDVPGRRLRSALLHLRGRQQRAREGAFHAATHAADSDYTKESFVKIRKDGNAIMKCTIPMEGPDDDPEMSEDEEA